MNESDRNELDAVARIRPEPAEPDPDTMRRHREALLQRAQDQNVRRVHRGRFRVPKLALGGAATAVAVGIAVIALVAGGVFSGPDPAGSPQEPGEHQADRAISLQAAAVLDKASQAARQQPAVPAQPAQWAYTKYVLKEPNWSETNQVWRQVDGSQTFVRTTRSNGTTHERYVGGPPDQQNGVYVPRLLSPSYAYLRDLPTDSEKLRQIVYHQARKAHKDIEQKYGDRSTVDQRAFSIVSMAIAQFGGLAGVDAGLYQVLKTIPGIGVRPDITDAIGRHGIGITYDSRQISMILIFDTETYEFLGARLPAQDRSTALAESGIVDQAGQLP